MDAVSDSDAANTVSARQCAAALLAETLERKRPLDEALLRDAAFARLSERDRNFTRLLVLTTLRRLGQIDALLMQMLASRLKGKSQTVMHCLRLGAAQLLWLGTPPHAAVHAMVETTAALGHERMKGLVNAVLKRVAREGAGLVAAQDPIALNLTAWLHESWSATYGESRMRAIAEVQLVEPPLDLTVKSDAAGWAERLGGEVLPGGSVRLQRAGRVGDLPGYAEGEWWVQDAAASMPARLLGDLRGLRVFDLCAAPGGKTAQLAAAGARVVVVDRSGPRLSRLRSNLERLRLEAEIVEADVLEWRPDGEAPDAILLDAPCSATGTLRRHPELAWQRGPGDVAELVRLQRRLLKRAAGWLTPGGRLVYCVCSLEPEEGEGQIEALLKRDPSLVRLSAKGVPEEFVTGEGALRTLPDQWSEKGGCDGFYAALLMRS